MKQMNYSDKGRKRERRKDKSKQLSDKKWKLTTLQQFFQVVVVDFNRVNYSKLSYTP